MLSPDVDYTPHKPVHPVLFALLILPFGIMTGYISTTLVYLFSSAGVSVEAVAGLSGAALIPQIFRFLWAPLIDSTLTVKKWYALSTILSALCLVAMSLVPIKLGNMHLIAVEILVANFLLSFSSMAASCFAAHDTPEDMKGRAGGYLNAGNVGGAGLGGGLGLWLAQRLPGAWMTGVVLAVICALCCIVLLFVKEPVYTVKVKRLGQTFKNLWQDVWGVVKSRVGIVVLFLTLMPIGTGAAQNIFAAIGTEWKSSANTVALITGVFGGVMSTLGCLVAGWICDAMNRRLSYALFSIVQGLACVAMAFLPHTQSMYIVWVSFYNFTVGLTYTAISAFVLETIGKGAATTKYEWYLSISNAPVYIMTMAIGWAHTRWGANGMFVFEAVCNVVGAVVFFGFQALLLQKKPNLAVSN